MLKFHLLVVLLVCVSEFSAIEQTCIKDCTCQSDSGSTPLTISDCKSPLELTAESFAKISDLHVAISFEHVIIESIDEKAFSKFRNLQKITFHKCSINKIDENALNLESLDFVVFSEVRFVMSPVLAGQNIAELHMINCDLTKVPNLNNLTSLEVLNLTKNKISSIDDDAFANVTILGEIYLSQNEIQHISAKLFEKNLDLNSLKLDNNPLTSIDIANNSNLEILSLRSCNLSVIDQRLTTKIKLVTSLDLSGNRIASLPIDVFEPMHKLNNIDLSNNLLVELDDEIFYENTVLEQIIMDNNNFVKLPNFRTKNSFLGTSEFSCNNCKLTSLNGVFNAMSALQNVRLANNNIQTLSKEIFANMHELKELDLSNNNIKSIPIETFEANSKLELLNLSGNKLTEINPATFLKNSLLVKLDVSNNELNKIWSSYKPQVHIEKLILARNNIKKLTMHDLTVVKNLTLIDVQDNPLECNVDELSEVMKFLIEHNVAYLDVEDDFDLTKDLDQLTYWKNKYSNICNEKLDYGHDIIKDFKISTINILPAVIQNDDDFEIEDEDNLAYDDKSKEEDNFDDENEDDYNKDEDENDENVEEEKLSNNSLPYILSLTSIFIITAVVVLCLVVTIAILILKQKNPTFENDSPRFRLPLFLQTALYEKNHSGTVYRHLTEEFETPRHSFIGSNKYEFKQQPHDHGQNA